MDETTPLEADIRRRIAMAGPMPVHRFMALCLSDPRHGYYTNRDPFGADGDFTTAPEISQIFGELIGLWAASVWRQMGAPEALQLVELGPGRGTMMADMLRAAKVVPGFHAAATVHLIEISPVLERRQKETLAGVDVPLTWHRNLDAVPDGPLVVVANEFFDALPVHQAIKQEDGWHVRTVSPDADGRLALIPAPEPLSHFAETLPAPVRQGWNDAIFEWRSDAIVHEIARRLVHFNGAALVIDYGHDESECGDTLQAVSHHSYADPLETPGLVDLTAHVDFQALGAAAERIGASVHGPLAQRDLLLRLGFEHRVAALKENANLEQAARIDSAADRLLSAAPDGMGRLFKAIAFANPGLGALPGFEP